MKTRCLLFPAALLFLSIVPTVAEVVDSVSDCDQFLLEKTPPQVPGILVGGSILNQNRFKVICQTFQNQRRFVTLYDIENKIPVFSASRYRGVEKEGRPPNRWKMEPQLENEDDKNMIFEDRNKTYKKQARRFDYRNSEGFDKGHLFPSSYAFSKTDKMSTFTLTNIVPQAGTFNQGSWNRMEKCIKCVMDKYCINNNGVIEGFVVTGAQPSANNTLINSVNIPSMLWSAFCCYSSNMKMWIASAHWGGNVPDRSKNKYLQTKTLAELRQELTTADSEFKVFPGTQCPLHTAVTEFYPEMVKSCDCPPSISTTSASPFSTSAPLTSTSGPLQSTPGPLTSTTSEPFTSTSVLLTSTSGPPPSTYGPQSTTPGLVTSTSGPLTSTSASLNSTSGTPSYTPGPLTFTTSVPLTFTSGPPPSTYGPKSSTPDPSTSGPLTSTSGPHTITSGPVTSTSVPFTVTSGLPNTTSEPLTFTSGTLISTSGSVTSTSAPLTFTSSPSSSASGPHTSTSGPLLTTSGPPTTTSTSDPVTSTSAHPTSTSGPPQSESGPHTTMTGTLTPPSGLLTSTSLS